MTARGDSLRCSRKPRVQLKIGLNRTKGIPTSVPTTRPQTSKVSCAAGRARPDGELKRNVDVGQQPQRRRAGRCRSVGIRARWNRRRLARARDHRQYDQRLPSVLRNLPIVVDDPVARCARPAPAPAPPSPAPRPGEADTIIVVGRPNEIMRARSTPSSAGPRIIDL